MSLDKAIKLIPILIYTIIKDRKNIQFIEIKYKNIPEQKNIWKNNGEENESN